MSSLLKFFLIDTILVRDWREFKCIRDFIRLTMPCLNLNWYNIRLVY